MLVLTRREGESVVIGGDVIVTVLGIRGGQVRLGFNAPKSVTVHRAEVHDQVAEQNRQAVASAQDGILPSITPRLEPDQSA